MVTQRPAQPEKAKTAATPVKAGDKEPGSSFHIDGEVGLRNRIHVLRGLYVMLDKDLAELYGTTPIRLRQQVKRNPGRFPHDFMFRIDENELESMVSQNVIPSRKHLGGSLPYAFTEQGIAGLSAVLTGPRAVQVHVAIMRAFVEMRRTLHAHSGLVQRLDGMEKRQLAFETETDSRFEQVFTALEGPTATPRQGIFYDGQVYDAHAFVSDLIRGARKSIVLIDNYIDDTVLTLLGKRGEGVSVVLYTRTVTPEFTLDLKKHNTQYPPVEVREFKEAHDRFLILDGETLYHLGASLKDLGKKWFAFSRFEHGAVEMLERLGRG